MLTLSDLLVSEKSNSCGMNIKKYKMKKWLKTPLLKKRNKKRLILDVDSTEDPAHGNQDQMASNGHFGKNCFHPIFCFTSDGDGLAAKLRAGNVHSANGTLDLIKPIKLKK